MAVEQIKKAIESFQVPSRNTKPSAMDTDIEDRVSSTHPHMLNLSNLTQLNLPAIIRELKNDIATITHEMRAMFKQCLTQQMTTTGIISKK